jgi:predicted SprT family Zn-dependent metalloprotease
MAGPRATQMELFRTALTAKELAEFLAAPGCALKLDITRNRGSMASVRVHSDEVRVRLDRAFLAAPDAVLEALRNYIRSPSRRAWHPVRCFAVSIRPDPRRRERAKVNPSGQVYDLDAIRDAVNRRFFGNRLKCRITWGRSTTPARGRSIRYGSYMRAGDVVRINPRLDDPRVPREFLEYIVFHEMLHAAIPAVVNGGRVQHHHAAYRALERQYPDMRRMRKLSAELVDVLRDRAAAAGADPATPAG